MMYASLRGASATKPSVKASVLCEIAASARTRRLAMTGCVFLFGLTFSGCAGYSTQTALPENIKSVHVPQVDNLIDISSDISNKKAFQTYRPGLEVELRSALIDRLIFDGHLKIASEDSSDATLTAHLTGFDREPLRYNANDTIQEFRIRVTASAAFTDKLTGKELWANKSITGESTYFLSGPNAASEDDAVNKALTDLVRHIVEDVLETW